MSPMRPNSNPESFVTRAHLIDLQMSRVGEQARAAARRGDLERLDELEAESVVLLEAMRTVREEQLLAELERTERPRRRPWWRFWR